MLTERDQLVEMSQSLKRDHQDAMAALTVEREAVIAERDRIEEKLKCTDDVLQRMKTAVDMMCFAAAL